MDHFVRVTYSDKCGESGKKRESTPNSLSTQKILDGSLHTSIQRLENTAADQLRNIGVFGAGDGTFNDVSKLPKKESRPMDHSGKLSFMEINSKYQPTEETIATHQIITSLIENDLASFVKSQDTQNSNSNNFVIQNDCSIQNTDQGYTNTYTMQSGDIIASPTQTYDQNFWDNWTIDNYTNKIGKVEDIKLIWRSDITYTLHSHSDLKAELENLKDLTGKKSSRATKNTQNSNTFIKAWDTYANSGNQRLEIALEAILTYTKARQATQQFKISKNPTTYYPS